MDKRFWAIIGIIVVIFGGIFYFTSKSNQEQADLGDAKPTNHVKGAADAKVTLVEYGDFQCPVCASYYPVLEQVQEKYEDRIKFQFRHFPLTSIHNNAFAASRAAEAAGMQGKFWEMYDLLYQNQQAWSQGNASSAFTGYAKQIGLNEEQYQKDVGSQATNRAVNADKAEGDKLKVNSTPTFYLNGKQLELGSLVDDRSKQPTLEKFSQPIDAALKEAGVEAPAPAAEDQPAATEPAPEPAQ